ncbi:MAG: hypothetical protein WC655_23625 [Candidatus Hydrogenedentales bacterium]|jgi:hypothetical protein
MMKPIKAWAVVNNDDEVSVIYRSKSDRSRFYPLDKGQRWVRLEIRELPRTRKAKKR